MLGAVIQAVGLFGHNGMIKHVVIILIVSQLMIF